MSAYERTYERALISYARSYGFLWISAHPPSTPHVCTHTPEAYACTYECALIRAPIHRTWAGMHAVKLSESGEAESNAVKPGESGDTACNQVQPNASGRAECIEANRYLAARTAADARGNSHGVRQSLFYLSGFSGNHGASAAKRDTGHRGRSRRAGSRVGTPGVAGCSVGRLWPRGGRVVRVVVLRFDMEVWNED